MGARRPDDVAGVDDLYRVDPDDFVRARDALVTRLRREGRSEEAADVKARRRPSPPVWALDQLAARAPDEVAALASAAAGLKAAQASGEGTSIRAAGDALQAAVAARDRTGGRRAG